MKLFISNLALFIGACLVILIPSIINGYPILFSDTGTYILSGMEAYVPIDRPYLYGLFLRMTSLWISLWYTAIFQAIFVNLFILAVFKYAFDSLYAFRNTLISVAVLSITTSLAYFTNHIVPDIFAPIVIMGVVLIVSRPKLPAWLIIILLVVVTFMNLSHFTNLLITTGLSFAAVLGGLLFFRKQWFRERAMALVLLGILSLSSWILLPTVNYIMGEGFVTSKAKNIFMMGNLIENGLMKSYLEETCPEKEYELCNYLDTLPDQTYTFVWEYDSPLYDGDCMDVTWVDCWLQRDLEYGIIIDDMFARRDYLWKFIGISIKSSLTQAISYKIQARRPEGIGSPVRYPMEKHLKRDYERYISARQQKEELHFKALSLSQSIFVPLAFLFLAICNLVPGIRKRIPLSLRIFTLGIFLALIVNAFACATFSHFNPRYQSRVIWLIPMLAIGYLLQFKDLGIKIFPFKTGNR